MTTNKILTLSGGAVAKNVFWVAASSVDIGAGTAFKDVTLTKLAATFKTESSLATITHSLETKPTFI
ncbi:hypothetical protein FRB97_000909 [Tulasnella sp. 331]|nr:hypothetical protein FRB97_000909 [Tulasnella sp. 331]